MESGVVTDPANYEQDAADAYKTAREATPAPASAWMMRAVTPVTEAENQEPKSEPEPELGQGWRERQG